MNPRPLAAALRVAAGALIAVAAMQAPSAASQDGGAALRDAASRGHLEEVRALLEAGADANTANEYGATPLILACMRGHQEVVRVLLEAGADAERADTFYGLTPLGWAGERGHDEIVSLLFAAGAGGFDELFTAAVNGGDVERVAELLAMHVPDAATLSSALQHARETRNQALGELLIRFGAVPPPPEILRLNPELLLRYEGVYVDEVGYELEVRADVDEGVLLVRPAGMRNALRFLAVQETTFIAESTDSIFIRFVLSDGVVASMTFAQPGDTRRMTRR